MGTVEETACRAAAVVFEVDALVEQVVIDLVAKLTWQSKKRGVALVTTSTNLQNQCVVVCGH